MKQVLQIQHVSKSFNGLNVLRDVTFEIQKGTVNSLFGSNGSGKTTLFNIITGYLKADSGQIKFKEFSLHDKESKDIARYGLGKIWQTPRVFDNLTVGENLVLAVPDHPGEKLLHYLFAIKKIISEEDKRREKAASIAETISLTEKLNEPAGSLSLGQKKLLSIGMVMMNNASLFLLDEPFSGVNSEMIVRISNVLNKLKEQGKTVLMIEHNHKKAGAISDQVFLLQNGIIMKREK